MDVRAVAAYLDRVVDRELGSTVHDEQWVAVLALLDGRAVQLDTGEGKTLVGALAATLEAWRGRQVHVATANDYYRLTSSPHRRRYSSYRSQRSMDVLPG